MNRQYDHEALWLKARLFTNLATDVARAFDERAVWASLALELLAKSALAKVSPLLIADVTRSGDSMLVASGIQADDSKFTTVAASTAYERCSKAFRPFHLNDAQRITRERNRYLHAGAARFSELPEHAWWPPFWSLVFVLVNAQDRELADLVRAEYLRNAEAQLEENKELIRVKAEALQQRAAQRLSQIETGNASARVAAEWQTMPAPWAGLDHSGGEICPVCGTLGRLEGNDVYSHSIEYDLADDGEPINARAELVVYSEYFGCPKCHLVLDGNELIAAAGLPETFGATDDVESWLEPEYGND